MQSEIVKLTQSWKKKKANNSAHNARVYKSSSIEFLLVVVVVLVVSCCESLKSLHTLLSLSYKLWFKPIYEIHCTFDYKQLMTFSSSLHLKIASFFFFKHHPTKLFVAIINRGVQPLCLSASSGTGMRPSDKVIETTIKATSCTFARIK